MALLPFYPLAQIGIEPGPGLLELFLQAGFMEKAVLGLLATMSLISWSIMVGKFFQFRRAARQSRKFLDAFRKSERFSEVNASAAKLQASPLVGLFQAGYVEIDSQIKAAGASPKASRVLCTAPKFSPSVANSSRTWPSRVK